MVLFSGGFSCQIFWPILGHNCCFNIESDHLISLFTQILTNVLLYQDFVSEALVSILSAHTDVNVNPVKSRIRKLTHVKVRFLINTGITDSFFYSVADFWSIVLLMLGRCSCTGPPNAVSLKFKNIEIHYMLWNLCVLLCFVRYTSYKWFLR